MRNRKSGTVFLFLGFLLIVIFAVGVVYTRNPGTFVRADRYDVALDHFIAFCGRFWPAAGIVGIPMFLVSLIRNLVREHREK